MFAVVKTGGKQYRVSPGDVIIVEKLLGESGDNVTLSDVLMVNNDSQTTVGTPYVAGSVVEATIREQARGDKIIVFKKKRRQGYRRKKGHRQDITVLTINAISTHGQTVARPVTLEKVDHLVSIDRDQLPVVDVNAEAIQPITKAVKKPAVRKPKVDTVELAVQADEPSKVSKPKTAATKVKKEQESEI